MWLVITRAWVLHQYDTSNYKINCFLNFFLGVHSIRRNLKKTLILDFVESSSAVGLPKNCTFILHFRALWAMEGHDNTPMGSFG